MSIRSRLTLLALPLFLAGCPWPWSGSSKPFDIRAVVVTVPDQPQATVTLSWDRYADASIYNVSRRDAGGPAQLVRTLSDLRYTESVARGATISYSVAALTSNGETKGTSPEKFMVAPTGVGISAVTDVAVEDASASTAPLVVSSTTPAIRWSAAPGANAYHVRVSESTDPRGEKPIFAVFTSATSVTVGKDQPLPGLDLTGYPQAAGSISQGRNYLVSITALRADSANLSSASAFDLVPMANPVKLAYF